MPEIFPNNELWKRGGHLHQKRHIDMTDAEKVHIAWCEGIKSDHPCKNPIFRCAACGNYGCAQEVIDKCSAQGFKNDKCLQCGAVGSRIPVMKDQLDDIIAKWGKTDL